MSKKKENVSRVSYYDQKAIDLEKMSLKRWYSVNKPYFYTIRKIRKVIKVLKKPQHLPLHIDFIRWMLIDLLSGKQSRLWGIYQFVALPGQGKTMSMVAHAERARASCPNIIIGANFGYVHADYRINHWMDIIDIAMKAHKKHKPCLIMMDEIHVTFDSSDWKSFPAELLALLSFNRKFELQFLCTSQIYERIPKKIRDIANYTVICKNVLSANRLFRCFYFEKDDYEARFDGKSKNAKFIREFVADNNFYALYDTLEQVDQMRLSAAEEKDKRQEAFDLLFGRNDDAQDDCAVGANVRGVSA